MNMGSCLTFTRSPFVSARSLSSRRWRDCAKRVSARCMTGRWTYRSMETSQSCDTMRELVRMKRGDFFHDGRKPGRFRLMNIASFKDGVLGDFSWVFGCRVRVCVVRVGVERVTEDTDEKVGVVVICFGLVVTLFVNNVF